MTTYRFRIRCELGAGVKIDSDDPRWVLASSANDGEDVILKPRSEATLGEARSLVLLGSSYGSAGDAETAGRRWMAALLTALARMNIGADFGDRAPPQGFTAHALELFTQQADTPVLDDVHGLMVFAEEQRDPRFVLMGPLHATVGKPGAAVRLAIETAIELGVSMTDQEQTSYGLYAGSFNAGGNADARFMLLMMALETLITQQDRAGDVRAHVNNLIEATKASCLSARDKESLLASLRWLRKESINQAGQRLARTLGNRQYMVGQPNGPEDPVQFFTRCYNLRNTLAHGHYPRPSRQDVDVRAASLETFLADLLAGPLRDFDPRVLRSSQVSGLSPISVL
jgi:hypothetical protein